jgi:hypothetical protein
MRPAPACCKASREVGCRRNNRSRNRKDVVNLEGNLSIVSTVTFLYSRAHLLTEATMDEEAAEKFGYLGHQRFIVDVRLISYLLIPS